jgi:hypothetical protein
MSAYGLALLVNIARNIKKQVRGPISRTITAVVFAHRARRAQGAHGDGAVRRWCSARIPLGAARTALVAGVAGVACFKQSYIIAFLPL